MKLEPFAVSQLPKKALALVLAGSGQYFSFVTIPAPGALALLGLGGLMGARRRR